EHFDEPTMYACLIAGGQRAEHYEMAAYGTLIAWAEVMGHTEAAELLQQTLDEEKAADEKLSALAAAGLNQSAAAGATRKTPQNATRGPLPAENPARPAPARWAAPPVSPGAPSPPGGAPQ